MYCTSHSVCDHLYVKCTKWRQHIECTYFNWFFQPNNAQHTPRSNRKERFRKFRIQSCHIFPWQYRFCLLDFLLVSTSTADILQDKNRTNAINSEDFFSKCYLIMLHLNLLKNTVLNRKQREQQEIYWNKYEQRRKKEKVIQTNSPVYWTLFMTCVPNLHNLDRSDVSCTG